MSTSHTTCLQTGMPIHIKKLHELLLEADAKKIRSAARSRQWDSESVAGCLKQMRVSLATGMLVREKLLRCAAAEGAYSLLQWSCFIITLR
jgi:hypothetical protein